MSRKQEAIPSSVAAWIHYIETGTDEALHQIAPHLSPHAIVEWHRGPLEGSAAIIAGLPNFSFTRPGLFAGVPWHRVASSDDDVVIVRGLCPPDRMFPGGRMSAFDFLFNLDDADRIERVRVKPHHTEPADVAEPLAIGAAAPDFSLPDVNGKMVTLSAVEAPATVVLWTGNQCPFARAWHDRLQAIARDYASRGVRMLQINANDPAVFPADAPENSRARAAEFAGPYLIDQGQKVAKVWGARTTPDVFVLDARSRVAYHGAPDADFSEDMDHSGPHVAPDGDWVRAALDAVLAGQPVARAETKPHGCNIKWTFDSPTGAI